MRSESNNLLVVNGLPAYHNPFSRDCSVFLFWLFWAFGIGVSNIALRLGWWLDQRFIKKIAS